MCFKHFTLTSGQHPDTEMAPLCFLVSLLAIATPLQAVVFANTYTSGFRAPCPMISLNDSWVSDPSHVVAGVRSFQFVAGY